MVDYGGGCVRWDGDDWELELPSFPKSMVILQRDNLDYFINHFKNKSNLTELRDCAVCGR